MKYYLHHYFDPDFDHKKLRPEQAADGSTDIHYLGYVQNCVAGQVLAELIPIDELKKRSPAVRAEPRFFKREAQLPLGPNTAVHPDDPNLLMANANGFCFYHNGLITVKKLLNVRSDVGFQTGNIFFANDLAVHGEVHTGFAIQARDILVKGHVEGVKIKALGNLVCLGGATGSNTLETAIDDEGEQLRPAGLLSARGYMRLAFCAHTQLRARKNVIIDASCMHSTVYAGQNLVVKERLQGGVAYVGKQVYVGEQLGTDMGGATRLHLGYDPFLVLAVQKLRTRLEYTKDKYYFFERQSARGDVQKQEFSPRLELAAYQLNHIKDRLWELELQLAGPPENAEDCRVIVPGNILPGCEINIAGVSLHVTEPMSGLAFFLQEGRIVWEPASKFTQSNFPEL